MSGLYVPLDVEYASDDKLIEAGHQAELLYIRGLCFAKRTMSDGAIKRSQLAAVGLGIPSAAKHAQRLVDVGAWTATTTGWRITAWLKRNKSAADIKADSDTKKANSALANHRRWHVGEGKEASISCTHCYPKPDPTADPKPDPTEKRLGSPKEEGREDRGKTESEGEVKPEEEGEGEGRQSLSSATALTIVSDQGDERETIKLIADARRLNRRTPPDDERAWRITVERDIKTTDGELIHRMLSDGTAPEQVALFVLGHGISTAEDRFGQSDCPTTCECAGENYIGIIDERGVKRLAPCPHRQAS